MSDNEQTTPTAAISENEPRAMDVLRFLHRNPGFFSQYPDLLAQLQVVDSQGSVTGLLNYQVKVLQERNQQLQKQLGEMVAAARSSEKLMDKVFELALTLSSLAPGQTVLNTFVDYVKKAFPSDFLALAVSDELLSPETRMRHVVIINEPESFRQIFAEALEQPLCGRVKVDKLEFLFAGEAAEIASVALVPLGEKGCGGLLAFGSADQQRFVPGMSTDILQRAAQLLYHKLQSDARRAETSASGGESSADHV